VGTGWKYRQLILDLDGTVYLDDLPIGRVIEHLNRLKAQGVELLVLTNNTSVSKRNYQRKLARLGLQLEISEVVSPTEVAGKFLREQYAHNLKGFVVGTRDLIEELAVEYGVQHVEEGARFVLVGFDKSLSYSKLQLACEMISRGIPFYATNIDISCPTQQGPIPDTGAIVQMLKNVTGTSPVSHFGKPGRLLVEHLLSMIDEPVQTLLAGDRLYTDIALGRKMGIDTLLVFSGEAKPDDLLESIIKPHYTAQTLEEFLSWHSTDR